MHHFLILIFLAAGALIAPALAQQNQIDYSRVTKDTTIQEKDVDLESMEAHGYGDIAEICRQMSPEQRAAILEAATARQKELEAMSPAERHKVEGDLKQAAGMLDQNMGLENVDASKLDTSKAKDVSGTMQDIKAYQNLQNPQPAQ